MAAKGFSHLQSALSSRSPLRIAQPDAAEASVALLLVDNPGAGLEALFIKRAEHPLDPWSGHIALPGGRRDPEDADALATVLREVREETGIALSSAQLLGELDDLHPRTPSLPSIVIRPFVFGLGQRVAHLSCSEVDACHWVSLKELQASAGTASVVIKSTTREVPCFRVEGHVLWGLTHRIVTQLLDLIG